MHLANFFTFYPRPAFGSSGLARRGIERVREAREIFHSGGSAIEEFGPVRRVEVFNNVYATGIQEREEHFEAYLLLAHRVSTIIDDDVVILELAKECAVALIADLYGYACTSVYLAHRVDVDTGDMGIRKILCPHLYRAAVLHADLEDVEFPFADCPEVLVVHFKIIGVFPRMMIKTLEWVLLCGLGHITM